MADKEQLAILKQGVDVWNKWRRRDNLVILFDLREANLNGADLRNTNLCEADLAGADLREAVAFVRNQVLHRTSRQDHRERI